MQPSQEADSSGRTLNCADLFPGLFVVVIAIFLMDLNHIRGCLLDGVGEGCGGCASRRLSEETVQQLLKLKQQMQPARFVFNLVIIFGVPV